MALPYEIHLAQRNLARHPWHTAAMAVGLGLAVLVMVYIPSTLASFYDDMIDRAVEQNSAHVTIWPLERRQGHMEEALRSRFGEQALVDLADRTFPRPRDLNGQVALAKQVRKVPGVIATASLVDGDATISAGRVSVGIALQGIEPREYARVVSIARQFPGRKVPKLGPNDIALGWRLADKLRVHIGDHIFVATTRTRRQMRVKAIFRSGYYDKDMSTTYVHLRTAQRMLEMGGEVSALALRCADLNQAGQISQLLDRRLNHKVRNWMDDNASLLAEIAMVQRIALFINVLVAMVATVGMANVFSIFVVNRRKEMAIMRAVGASRASLRNILLLEAGFIWLVGAIIGYTISLGVMAYEQMNPLAVSAELYGIGSYATSPKAEAFITTAVLTILTMLFSALWSGRTASKMSPAQVIFGQ